MKSRLLWFVLLVFSLCSPAALLAQDTASITGTVTDPSGAAIPAAQVTLISAERGINRTTATNGSGDYLFASLPLELTISRSASRDSRNTMPKASSCASQKRPVSTSRSKWVPSTPK